MADALRSGRSVLTDVWVQIPPSAPIIRQPSDRFPGAGTKRRQVTRACSSVERALPCGGRGREFESRQARHLMIYRRAVGFSYRILDSSPRFSKDQDLIPEPSPILIGFSDPGFRETMSDKQLTRPCLSIMEAIRGFLLGQGSATVPGTPSRPRRSSWASWPISPMKRDGPRSTALPSSTSGSTPRYSRTRLGGPAGTAPSATPTTRPSTGGSSGSSIGASPKVMSMKTPFSIFLT